MSRRASSASITGRSSSADIVPLISVIDTASVTSSNPGRPASSARSVARRRLNMPLEESKDEDTHRGDSSADDVRAPKRRKMDSTMAFVYQTMFKEGQDSNVTLHALDRKWRLHRTFLSRSPYFRSMFSGNWLESGQDEIKIEIVDPNVTMLALETALGSLYSDEVQLNPDEVVNVAAAAALFQLDDLLTRCSELMRSCVTVQTVVNFLEAATAYGLPSVERCCRRWLELNLMTKLIEQPAALRQLQPSLMAELVASPQLLIFQTEFSLYKLLKAWLFLRLSPEWSGTRQEVFTEAHHFFQGRGEGAPPVLKTEEAAPLAAPFHQLRLQHLVLRLVGMEVLTTDNILPANWTGDLFRSHWLTMLQFDQGVLEPGWSRNVTEAQFDAYAMRCGRLFVNGTCTWRFNGFNFGLDLVLVHKDRQFSLVWGVARHELSRLVSHADRRDVVFRVRVMSYDQHRRVWHEVATRMESVQLKRGEQTQVLAVPQEMEYPLLLSARVMTTPPAAWRAG